jgi:hypothetical protein
VSRDPTGGGPQLGSRARMQGGHVCNRHVPDIRARRSASSYGSQQPCWERDGRWHRRVRWMLPPRRSAVRRLPKAQWERERILPSRSASSLEAKKQPNHIYIYICIYTDVTQSKKRRKKNLGLQIQLRRGLVPGTHAQPKDVNRDTGSSVWTGAPFSINFP